MPHSAQELYGITPDLTVLGKVIGGGLPVAAYGGRRALMERMAPVGDVYQADTLSGNPLAMAAGIATLDALAEANDAYARLDALAARLTTGIERAAATAGVPLSVARAGSVLTPFFASSAPRNYEEAKRADTAAFARFHRGLLDGGVHVSPSQFEGWFVSLAHDEALIDRTIEVVARALGRIA